MLHRTKALVVATTALAAALAPAGTAATAGARMAACQVKSLGTHSEFGQFVAIFGTYKGPVDAVDVQLTCGVVQGGQTVAQVTDPLPGPAAALGDLRQIYSRLFVTSCYEISVTRSDGSTTHSDTCP